MHSGARSSWQGEPRWRTLFNQLYCLESVDGVSARPQNTKASAGDVVRGAPFPRADPNGRNNSRRTELAKERRRMASCPSGLGQARGGERRVREGSVLDRNRAHSTRHPKYEQRAASKEEHNSPRSHSQIAKIPRSTSPATRFGREPACAAPGRTSAGRSLSLARGKWICWRWIQFSAWLSG